MQKLWLHLNFNNHLYHSILRDNTVSRLLVLLRLPIQLLSDKVNWKVLSMARKERDISSLVPINSSAKLLQPFIAIISVYLFTFTMLFSKRYTSLEKLSELYNIDNQDE